ncbi:hypothetical protein ES702_03821 [subsurface metagenome]
MDNKRILGLLCVLLLVWGCAGFLYNLQGSETIMFPDCSKEEVMQACFNHFLKLHNKVTWYDEKTGIIQAERVTEAGGLRLGAGFDMNQNWSIQILEGKDGVSLSVHLHKQPDAYGGASKWVNDFIIAVRRQLKKEEKIKGIPAGIIIHKKCAQR